MRSTKLLDLIFMMAWLEHILIQICRSILLLLYDDTHLHGCSYDMHLSHLKTHGFSCSTLGSFDVGGTSSNTRVNRFMIVENFCCQPHTLLCLYDSLIHGCMGETSLSHLKSPCFFAQYMVQIWVEILHSLLGWKNTWLNILMHITSFWRRIIGRGILTYVIGEDFIGHLKLYPLGKWWSTYLEV